MAASELSKRARSEETLQIMKDVKGQFFFRQGIISGVEVDLHLYISILFTLFMMILSGRFNIEVREMQDNTG